MSSARPQRRSAVTRKLPSEMRIEAALAGLAHDIRTPLTGIIAFAELLTTSNLPEREERWAQAIKSAGEHLAQLTTLVVDAAKADATGLVLRRLPFSPAAFARDAAASLMARAEAKGLAVTSAIAPDLPDRVEGDAVRLRSALENLFDNAVKFTERGSIGFEVAALPTARGKTRLVFTVTDSGMGIAATDLKRLLKPFSQANDEIARRYGGAGLGLASVERIARALRGSLTVGSEPGRGSRFRLSVLMHSPRPGSRTAALDAPVPHALLRILCVEDNPYGRVVLKVVLRELGHQVAFAGSGEAAIVAVERSVHDLVLMDVTLPGIDGFETARRIRKLPGAVRRIPIIGVSGRSGDDDEAAAKAAGMSGYLRKPAGAAELAATLGRFAKKAKPK